MRYFVFDSELSDYFEYDNQEDRDQKVKDLIDECNYGGEWDEDRLNNFIIGIATHVTQQTNVKPRPDNLLNDQDDDGNYWGDLDYMCEYEMTAIAKNSESPINEKQRTRFSTRLWLKTVRAR